MSGPMVMFNPYVVRISQIDSCAEQGREGNKHAFDVMRALDCWTRLAKGTRLEKCFVCDTCTSGGNLGGYQARKPCLKPGTEAAPEPRHGIHVYRPRHGIHAYYLDLHVTTAVSGRTKRGDDVELLGQN